jgi:uncharacterized protein (TIGR02246 family)
MPRRGALAAALFLGLATQAHGAGGVRSADDAAIRAVEARQVQTWNAHDIRGYVALFTEDADVVNVLGWRWRGRAELERKLTLAHGSVFRTSVLTLEAVDIRLVAPSVAVVQVTWRMAGAQAPEAGVQTQVLERGAGGWRISAFQNTNSVPERPFPPPS